MDFSFTVNASVERTQGKFASRDEIEEQLVEALEGANPGTVEGSEGGEYEVGDWSVEATEQVKPGKKRAPDLGRGVVDSRRLGDIPEMKVLARAWHDISIHPEKASNTELEAFEHAMEQAFQLITSSMG